jgi:hypothetical protein
MHSAFARRLTRGRILALVAATALTLTVAASVAAAINRDGQYLAGDFHTHTYLTDGERRQTEVVHNAFDKYGLDWMANSEHGGLFGRDAFGQAFATPKYRWETIKTYSFPMVADLRNIYADKMIVQGLEWNVPTHEHASVGIIADEPTAVSDFEYTYDQNDGDTSRAGEGLVKTNTTHANAVAGAAFLQTKYADQSYFLLNHPSRKLKYSIADIRDFNNVAPDVAFGFEGMPGHQKEPARGGYGNSFADPAATAQARTYGGADYMVAKVGGLWDALLGEGRHFWTFVNSDFHDTNNDFWPGEYAKSYTRVKGSGYEALLDGMRSGDSFAVHGGLIDELDFTAANGKDRAGMGDTLTVKSDKDIRVRVRFRSPAKNYNGDRPKVDHVDVIVGEVRGKVAPSDPNYNSPVNATTTIAARLSASDLKVHDGWTTAELTLKDVDVDSYIRLRGTNLGTDVAGETSNGEPLVDSGIGLNDAAKAYKDLWFYSNPIFVDVQ